MFKNLLIITFGLLLMTSAAFASDSDKISQRQGNSFWQRLLNGNDYRYNNNRNYNNNDRNYYGRDNYRNSDRNNNNNNRRYNRRNRNY